MNNLSHAQIVEATIAFLEERFATAESGHDMSHTLRVWRLAQSINQEEGGNTQIVDLAALLHDVADAKFHTEAEDFGATIAKQHLEGLNVSPEVVEQVCTIVEHISFKGGQSSLADDDKPLEFRIVQDADRLEALGAIGIARAFSYGGYKWRTMYDPNILPRTYTTAEEYRKSNGTTINHFYEKLFQLKDAMHTKTGKRLAEDRHQYMEAFVGQFMAEWNGKR